MSDVPDTTLLQRIVAFLDGERTAEWVENLSAIRKEIADERNKAAEFVDDLDLAEYDLDEAEYQAEFELGDDA